MCINIYEKLQIMKKLLFLLVITTVLIPSNIFGQSNSTDKYIYSEALLVSSSNGIQSSISFGQDGIIQVEKKDEIIKKIKEFKDGVDIMNYLSNLDWEYVDKQVQFQIINNGRNITTTIYWFYTFRKKK